MRSRRGERLDSSRMDALPPPCRFLAVRQPGDSLHRALAWSIAIGKNVWFPVEDEAGPPARRSASFDRLNTPVSFFPGHWSFHISDERAFFAAKRLIHCPSVN